MDSPFSIIMGTNATSNTYYLEHWGGLSHSGPREWNPEYRVVVLDRWSRQRTLVEMLLGS